MREAGDSQGWINHLDSAGVHVAPFSLSLLLFFVQNREPHRAHQAHLVDLFSHMNFYPVSAGPPSVLWRGEREVAGIIFKRNVHGILSDHHGGIEARYRFRKAVSEYLESLIMLVKMEHNEDCRDIGTEPVGRVHWYNFVGTLKTKFFVEPFRRRNSEEKALRWGVEIVGGDLLGAVLEIWDGGILDDRQFRRLEYWQRREGDDYGRCDCPLP